MANIQVVLGNNVRRLRNRNGWSQIFLADKLDVSVSFISIIESGQRGVSLTLIEDIASVFKVPIPYLFTDNEDADSFKKMNIEFEKQEMKEDLKIGISEYIDKFFSEQRH